MVRGTEVILKNVNFRIDDLRKTVTMHYTPEEKDMSNENPFGNHEMDTSATDSIVVREVDKDKVKLLIENLNPEVADLIEATVKDILKFVKMVK